MGRKLPLQELEYLLLPPVKSGQQGMHEGEMIGKRQTPVGRGPCRVMSIKGLVH